MKNSIQLLDTSLRDGGHRTNFHFKNDELATILPLLDNSGIDYIEIGYKNGSLIPTKHIGAAGWCAEEYLLFCHTLIKKAKIAVMVYSTHVNQNDLKQLKACGVDLLRICIVKNKLDLALPLIEMAQKANLKSAVNLTHISHYSNTELDEVIKKISAHQPDVIYFADSNGSVLPARITELYERYINTYIIPFGFHAHDNLGLAQANALAAMNSGVKFIDVSLAGMGKGMGNLKTEFFTAYLHAIGIKKYNLNDVLKAANYVRDVLKIGCEHLDIDEFMRGVTDS